MISRNQWICDSDNASSPNAALSDVSEAKNPQGKPQAADSPEESFKELWKKTDFVANTDDFRALAKDIAMHIASTNPISISQDEISEDVIERERAVYMEQAREEGKPEEIAVKIVEGRLQKFFKESTLLAQPFVKNPDVTVEQLITEVSGTVGEKIEVARFARMKIGE